MANTLASALDEQQIQSKTYKPSPEELAQGYFDRAKSKFFDAAYLLPLALAQAIPIAGNILQEGDVNPVFGNVGSPLFLLGCAVIIGFLYLPALVRKSFLSVEKTWLEPLPKKRRLIPNVLEFCGFAGFAIFFYLALTSEDKVMHSFELFWVAFLMTTGLRALALIYDGIVHLDFALEQQAKPLKSN